MGRSWDLVTNAITNEIDQMSVYLDRQNQLLAENLAIAPESVRQYYLELDPNDTTAESVLNDALNRYATSLAAATARHAQVTNGTATDRAEAVDRYLELLRSGASDHPVELLRRAGVDLTDPESLSALVEEMDLLVTRLEGELAAFTAS